jgi:hypothetical protein
VPHGIGTLERYDDRVERTLGNELVFVIRMWLRADIDGSEADEWRGSIEQLGSGRKLYVSNPSDIAEFVTTILSEESRRSRGA